MSNRAAKYEQLHKSLKKHYKTLPEPGERSVLEHLLYACCLEDAKAEHADEAFAKLQQAYFDWNEVRVTTVIELAEALASLPNPTQAGHRIKRCLQSLFEARYQYDIDDLKKANLSKATEEMSAWKGVSPFVLNYVSQSALGGHAIPADTFTLQVMVDCEILTQAEAEKKVLTGVERAIPKNRGSEFASLLHQFAVEFHQQPKNAAVLAVFKDLGITQKIKTVEKPAAKKEVKAVVASSQAVPPSKAKSEPIENTKKAESGSTKKSEKTAAVEPVKAKDLSSKADAKADAKSDKVADTKKKTDSKVEAKTTAIASTLKTGGIKKTEPKPSKKEDKVSAKKPAQKPAAKPAAKQETKPETKPAAKEVKKPTAQKASKPTTEAKKSTPAKKRETAPATSKKTESNTSRTKKKPR